MRQDTALEEGFVNFAVTVEPSSSRNFPGSFQIVWRCPSIL
jgi:hypothetical protein